MTHKERMLAVLNRQSPDRIPWFPRLEMWYNAHKQAGTLPEKYRGWDVRSIYREQGAGFHGKWGTAFRTEVEGVETVVQQKGEETRVETVTPVGSVSTLKRHSPELRAEGIGPLEIEHMIKGPEDYPVVEWIYQHTRVEPTYEDFLAFDGACGEDGIALVNTPWNPAFYLFGQLIGWNQCYLHLYDYPQEVDRLLATMTDFYWEIHRACARSPARVISHGAHFHAEMTPPPIFRQYFLPNLKEVADYYHEHGKILMFHGDADLRGLEGLILEVGYDIAECLVTSPMVDVTLDHFRRAWGDRMIIWGGIPSIVLCEPFTDAQFEAYMRDLFRTIVPGDAFILGVSDMLVPATRWERVERVSEMVEEWGAYPIDASGL